MDFNERTYKKLRKNFDLLGNIVSKPKDGESLKVDLSKIDEIINKEIPNAFKDNAPEDFYEVYTDFRSQYEKFRDFIMYDSLIGKNVVALGGGFSSGKSSFLNALMEREILPSDIDPSTSVPTYIVSGDTDRVDGINIFDSRVSMRPADIRKISHGFGAIEDEDGETVTEGVTLGHLLDNLFLSTPLHRFKNIAFLDTPGYSKPDSEEYTAKTDAKIARGQLNSSNYILWFVQSDAGTITEEDIKFIKTLRAEIPKLIILNKADKKNIGDLKKIANQIKSTLKLKGVGFVDVLAFTSRSEQVADKGLDDFLKAQKAKIIERLEKWNSAVYESNFAANFKELFVDCKNFYDEEIEEESRRLSRVNKSLTLLQQYDDIDDKTLNPLKQIMEESQRNIKELKAIKDKLKTIQDEFFGEIKIIADKVGISMPEPSEIDLLKKTAHDPLEIIKAYKEKKGIKSDPGTVQFLRREFENISPSVIQSIDERIKKTADMIKKEMNISRADIAAFADGAIAANGGAGHD